MLGETSNAVLLCCFLWARPGQEAGLESYEDRVLALVPEHRGVVLQRAKSDGAADRPHEVQLFRFADQDALDDYLNDPRRLALADERDRVIARTETFPVTLL
jgi:antibiotic biosynthesis monooxygenase (ABM) superfamily enzyme